MEIRKTKTFDELSAVESAIENVRMCRSKTWSQHLKQLSLGLEFELTILTLEPGFHGKISF